jgi:hypothetical protein
MKLIRLCLAVALLITLVSCSSMKDCQGVKHQRLPNGIRL